MPSEGLWQEYERFRAEHQDQRYGECYRKLKERERDELEKQKPKPTVTDYVEIAKKIPEIILTTLTGKKKMKVSLLMKELKCTQYRAYQIRNQLLPEEEGEIMWVKEIY